MEATRDGISAVFRDMQSHIEMLEVLWDWRQYPPAAHLRPGRRETKLRNEILRHAIVVAEYLVKTPEIIEGSEVDNCLQRYGQKLLEYSLELGVCGFAGSPG